MTLSVSDYGLTDELLREKDLEQSRLDFIAVPSLHLPGGTEEIRVKPRPG
jgi:hypothetical protein